VDVAARVGQGRVVWIGVADWHKHAISEPQLLALWWQSAMDRIALDSAQKTVWQMNDPMPCRDCAARCARRA
jgi:hypothetical protein